MNESLKERVNAYVDGELDPASVTEFRHELRTNQEAQALLFYLSATNTLAKQAYSAAFDRPIPEKLLRVLEEPEKRSGWRTKPWWTRIAAVFAVVTVGLGSGYLVARFNAAETIAGLERQNARLQLALESTIAQALEFQPSGTSLTEAGDAARWRLTVTPLQTFRTPDNQYCRQFRQEVVRDDVPDVLTAIRCRVGKGQWKGRVGGNVSRRQVL